MEGQLTFHAETNLVIFWLLYARFFSASKASATPRKVSCSGTAENSQNPGPTLDLRDGCGKGVAGGLWRAVQRA